MTDRILSPRNYLIVLAALLSLTVLTVALSFLPGSGVSHVLLGQSIAVVKASLVVLFFMHALRSSAQTRAVIVVTVFWFVVVLCALTLSDYSTREMLPDLPGH
jgi:cytochrome c oxidase subunit IV